MTKRYLILSCDGGGIRGLLTALLLKELDKSCSLLKRADLFVGTSTGGILAIGLAGELGIEKLIDLYKTKASNIFEKSDLPLTEKVFTSTAGKSVDGFLKKKGIDADLTGNSPERLFAVKYSNEGLRKTIQSYFPADPLLTGLSRKVLVTTFRLDSPDRGWTPVILHNLEGQGQKPIKSHVVESAMCTSAAPTYFEPYWHGQLGYCVDGGVFANNPGSLGVSAAVAAGEEVGNIAVLSVGTGGLTARYPFKQMGFLPQYLGILPWMWPKPSKKYQTPEMPLLAAVFGATSASDQMVCEGLLGERYLRVQAPIKEDVELDNIAAMPQLEKAASEYVNSKTWEKVVTWTKQQFQE